MAQLIASLKDRKEELIKTKEIKCNTKIWKASDPENNEKGEVIQIPSHKDLTNFHHGYAIKKV